jgi:methionine-rich copper-binding protein CopC
MPSRTFPRRLRSTDARGLAAIGLLVVVIGVGVVASAKAWSKLQASTPATAAAYRSSVKLASSLIPQSNGLQRELITIRQTGFDPEEIKRAPEAFLLAIDNKSGLGQLTLRITREDGLRVHESSLSPERFKVREKINLPPGEYLLTALDHPDWLCRLTITP